MANPFSSNPFNSDPSSSGARKESHELGPDETAPGEVTASNPTYQTFGQGNLPFQDARRSTGLGPDEIAPGQLAPSSPAYATYAAASPSRRSTGIGPDEIAPGQFASFGPTYNINSPGDRRSTNIGPDEVVGTFYTAPSTPAWRTHVAGDRRSTNIGPDEVLPSRSPFADPNDASPNPGERRSTQIGPDEIGPSPTPFATPNYVSSTPGTRKSTKLGPDEIIPNKGTFATPDYQSDPSGRKSTKLDPYEMVSMGTPFTSPDYKTPNSGGRKSTRYGPDEIPSSPSSFSSPSYKHYLPTSRRSTNLGPHERAPKQGSMLSWRSTKLAGRGSTSSGPDEVPSVPTTPTPAWRKFSSGSRRSTNVGPHDVVPPSQPSAVNVMTARTSEERGPFSFSPNPFAKPEKAALLPTFEALPGIDLSPIQQQASRNFPNKLAHGDLPAITVPPGNSGADGTITTPIINDTPMRDTFRTASLEPKKETRAKSEGRTASVALALPFADVTLAPVAQRASRRSSTAAPPSALADRRTSSVGMGGPRRSSVSITNVVIPAHLLTHVETNWQEDKVVGRRKSAYQREDSRSSFNVQQMAQQQQEEVKNIVELTPNTPRTRTMSMDALAVADPFAASRARNQSGNLKRSSRGQSLAAVAEPENIDEENDKADEENEKDDDGDDKHEVRGHGSKSSWSNFSFQGRQDDISPSAGMDSADPWDTAGAALAKESEGDTTGANGFLGAAVPPRKRSMWRPSLSIDPHATYNGERRGTIFQRAGSVFQDTFIQVKKKVRRSSMWDLYNNAKKRQVEIRRKRWVQVTFEYTFYAVLVLLLYFLIIGVPLWKGTYWELYLAFKYKLNVTGTWSVVIVVAVLYAYSPLFILFEPDPPMPEPPHDPHNTANVSDTALMIPCYKAANLIGATLEAATKVFPPENIFVVANGNSPTPLDNTEEVCRPYGVNHIWSPVGSKIVAQFVGSYAAKDFKNVLLIDDDCALPPNFPIVSDRMKGKVNCIGYTIKSVGPESSRGTLCQQAQDLEYKISGIQRALAGKIGSATFPHGAISLWNREFLIKTFNKHPGFSVSEDWFFGHVARQLGCRTQMATSVFIETETPPAVFFSSGGARGGFGEMTVFKQRFMRWNFFFVNGMYYNLQYLLFSWNLGWWECGTKLFVFQEIYETLLYLATPLVVPISIIVRPSFFFELMALTFVLYFLNVLIFNELHLRRKNERVPSKCLWLYYMPYKLVLTFVNVASCYYAIYKYATYFANRHPKIIEDDKAINVVLQLEEEEFEEDGPALPARGRRMSVTAVGSQVDIPVGIAGGRRMTITAMGQRFGDANIAITEEEEEEREEEEKESSVFKPQERKASITMVKTGQASALLDTRRPSITVGGRRISIGAATVIDQTAPAGKTRRSSDAFRSKGVSAANVALKPNTGRRSSDAFQSKGLGVGGDASGSAKSSRRNMTSALNASFMNGSVIEELAEEEEREASEQEKTPITSRRSSKQRSLVHGSRSAPRTPTAVNEPAPVVTNALMDRLQAIEEALNARGIGAVDFTIQDDLSADALAATIEENEDDESFSSNSSSPDSDEKKHVDAQSMV